MNIYLIEFHTFSMPCTLEAWKQIKESLTKNPKVKAKEYNPMRIVGVVETVFTFAFKSESFIEAAEFGWKLFSSEWKKSSDKDSWKDDHVGIMKLNCFDNERS